MYTRKSTQELELEELKQALQLEKEQLQNELQARSRAVKRLEERVQRLASLRL